MDRNPHPTPVSIRPTSRRGIAKASAPLLALCSARLERRAVLVGLSALVLVSDVIAGIAPGIGVMLAARAVLGIGVGGFWVFGAGAAIRGYAGPRRTISLRRLT